ncbi:hypothetical protein AHAS_Ahas06G0179200 [Arachis hypogaea]
METWTEDCKLNKWNNDMLRSMRVELMMDIVIGAHNESIDQVRTLLEQNDEKVCRNCPRNKKKEVKLPFTAPSTKTLMKRVGELCKIRLING